MNDKDLAVKRNSCARLFKHMSKIHRNCIRCVDLGAKPDMIKHEENKWRVCLRLRSLGHHFLTEAESLGGEHRADVVDLDEWEVIEIAVTESLESLETKRKFWESQGLKFTTQYFGNETRTEEGYK